MGTWEENQIKEGRWIFPSGNYYEGGFLNNKPNGKGKWVFKDGNVTKGFFKQEKANQDDDDDEAEQESELEDGEVSTNLLFFRSQLW